MHDKHGRVKQRWYRDSPIKHNRHSILETAQSTSERQTWDTVVESKKCGEDMYALSSSVHGVAPVFGIAGILGGGSVAMSVACC